MKVINFLMFFGLAISSLFVSCGDEPAEKTEKSVEKAVDKTSIKSVMKYTLTPFSESPAYTDAKIEMSSYKKGKFSFKVAGTDYKLGVQTPDAPQKMCANSGKGQHIHLIVDNAPYSAQYTSNFEYDVADGDHFLLAFLSRSYHESIKTPEAHLLKQVTVKNKSITAFQYYEGMMLNYSRPKGTYVGKKDTEKVMLDFYLNNVQIGHNFFVMADINGEVHKIDTWQPYYITGLPMGENTIKLTLVDSDGNRVNAPHNPVERTFTLKEDPADGVK